MRQPKALLHVDAGDTFVSRIVRTLHGGGVGDVVVVVGAGGPVRSVREALAAVAPAPRVVVNPDPSRGQLSSLLAGLEAIDRPGVAAMMLTLVDVPLVAPGTVRALLEAYSRTRAPLVRPVHPSSGTHGHPVVFDRALFGELRGADPGRGAKPVVRAHQASGVDVPLADDGAYLDIDTPEDYRRAFGRPPPFAPG